MKGPIEFIDLVYKDNVAYLYLIIIIEYELFTNIFIVSSHLAISIEISGLKSIPVPSSNSYSNNKANSRI